MRQGLLMIGGAAAIDIEFAEKDPWLSRANGWLVPAGHRGMEIVCDQFRPRIVMEGRIAGVCGQSDADNSEKSRETDHGSTPLAKDDEPRMHVEWLTKS
jgi:hypothetical protein